MRTHTHTHTEREVTQGIECALWKCSAQMARSSSFSRTKQQPASVINFYTWDFAGQVRLYMVMDVGYGDLLLLLLMLLLLLLFHSGIYRLFCFFVFCRFFSLLLFLTSSLHVLLLFFVVVFIFIILFFLQGCI